METTAIQEPRAEVIEVSDTPQEMSLKLADMKTKLGLVQRFFREVMVKDQDYGVIPGSDKPSLLKPGAEKLCELYGYAPIIKQVEEEKNIETGFYRARVIVALVHRRSGAVVAEGVGEANTMEGRYRWRWAPEWKLPGGIDKAGLYSEVRKDQNGKTYRIYRIQNEDPWSLWNTVLKMAKKRALIDATLSATRSSGLFTQDVEDLEEWVEAGVTETEPQDQPNKATTVNNVNWGKFWSSVRNLGFTEEEAHNILGVKSLKDVVKSQADANTVLQTLAAKAKEQKQQAVQQTAQSYLES